MRFFLLMRRRCEHYALIRSSLEQSGRTIGPNDLVIAATALAHRAVLVTCNAREFARVKSLVLEDWTTD